MNNETIELAINGEVYHANKVEPSCVRASDKRFMFYGIDWRMLDRPPVDMQISRLRITDTRYWCRPVEKWEIDTNLGALYFFWNHTWYEGLRIPTENLTKSINN